MFGRYRLLGRLAAGGMAEVWAAQLLAPGGFCKPMVIKRVLPELATSPSFLRMLMSEARVAARLSHTNICAVFELGEVDGEYYIAMEYLRGASVTRMLRTGGALPPAEAVAIVAQACEGLHYAHEQRDNSGNLLGLVHRDVSPHNLFVTTDGLVKLLDFGIAKVDDGSSERTEAGKVKGKLPYMSPEQLMGQPLDRRSDVWSLGVVFWELLTGRRLFGGGGLAATIDAIRSGKTPTLASAGIDSPRLDEVMARALCHNREWRHASAAELRRALLQALEPAPPATTADLAQEVTSRCAADVAHADALFDESEGPPSPDVVDRLPLRAEATMPSYQVDLEADAGAELDDVIGELPDAQENTVPSVQLTPVVAEPTVPVVTDDSGTGVELRRRMPVFALFGAAALVGAAVMWLVIRPGAQESREPPPAPAAGEQELLRASGPPEVVVTAQSAVTEPEPSAPEKPAPPTAEVQPVVEPPPAPAATELPSAPEAEPVAEPGPPTPSLPPLRGEREPARKHEARPAETENAREKEKPRPAADKDKPRPAADKEKPRPAADKVEAKPGRLFLDARPWATVYVDGAKIGVTPIVGASLAPGPHTVKAVSADGATRTLKITVQPGGEVRRRVTW